MSIIARISLSLFISAIGLSIAISAELNVTDNCTLVDAIKAADTDTPVGACPAGAGVDNIILEPDTEYTLTSVSIIQPAASMNNPQVGGPFYLAVNSQVNIIGNGAQLVTDFQPPANPNAIDANDIGILLITKDARVELSDITINGGISAVRNTSISDGGLVKGASITNFGQLIVTNSKLTSSKTHFGFLPTTTISTPAALANYGDLTIKGSQVTENETTGIFTADSATTTIIGSSITLNRFTSGIINRGHTEIANSTIAANLGSQIYLENGTMAANNITVVGVVSLENDTTFTIANTLLSNQLNNSCHFVNSNDRSALIDAGNNWFEDSSCNGVAQGNPLLVPFDQNTHFPQNVTFLAESPLVDAGNNSVCNATPVAGVDQLGINRPQGQACDIGALELEKTPSGIVFQQSVAIDHQLIERLLLTENDFPNSNFSTMLVGYGPATSNGFQPGVVRLNTVATNRFSADLSINLGFQEFIYLDQFHVSEQIDLMGFSPGMVRLDDGTVIVADSFTLTGNRRWETVNFPQTLTTTPRLFLFAQSSNGGQPPVLRARNVSNSGFEASMSEEETLIPTGHILETVAYFAIYNQAQQGNININGEAVEFNLAQIPVNHNWTTIFGVQIKLQEEQSLDQEIFHVNELVDVFKLGEQVFAQSVTNFGIDPITIRKQ